MVTSSQLIERAVPHKRDNSVQVVTVRTVLYEVGISSKPSRWFVSDLVTCEMKLMAGSTCSTSSIKRYK